MNRRETYSLANIVFKQPFDVAKVKELMNTDMISSEDKAFCRYLSRLPKPELECKLKPNLWGRYSWSKSLMTLSKKSRHYICKDDYVDFDMVKSQPTLFVCYFLENGLDSPKLTSYVDNPNYYIEKVISDFQIVKPLFSNEKQSMFKPEDVSKQLFTSLTNLGSLSGWLKNFSIQHTTEDITFYKEFEMEMYNNIVYCSNKIELELFEYVKDKQPENTLSSFSAMLYQELETRIMESLFQLDLKEFIGTYCFDGIMVPKSMFDGDKTIEGFLQCVHNNIVKRFGDCYERVRFIDKAMNDAWIIDTEEHKTEYDKMKSEFEKDNKHFYMIETKKYYRKINKQDGSISYVEHTSTEFKQEIGRAHV